MNLAYHGAEPTKSAALIEQAENEKRIFVNRVLIFARLCKGARNEYHIT